MLYGVCVWSPNGFVYCFHQIPLFYPRHYNGVIMGAIASQMTSFTIVYLTFYSDPDQRKHQSSASLAFVVGNSPVTGEFPAQMASNAENVSIWWRHHGSAVKGQQWGWWLVYEWYTNIKRSTKMPTILGKPLPLSTLNIIEAETKWPPILSNEFSLIKM